VDEGLQMFAVKRSPPGLNASQYRYLNYYAGLVAEPPILPHRKPLTIATLTVSPVPLFTKQRDGCRPYVELFQGDQRIISTLTEYERMRVYHATEDKVLNMDIFSYFLEAFVFHFENNKIFNITYLLIF
jgi:cyclin G-associated kinase